VESLSAGVTLKNDVVDSLREMARRQSSVKSMVEFVNEKLAHSEVAIIPMMSYFCRAFSVPLRDVLPLREWVHSHDDETIAVLKARIESFGASQPTTPMQLGDRNESPESKR
jgi:hypothetical protein